MKFNLLRSEGYGREKYWSRQLCMLLKAGGWALGKLTPVLALVLENLGIRNITR